jgi:hypothetical protein
MIGRKPDPKHPDDPGRAVFSPFRYDRQSGHWVPIESADAAFLADIDAGRVCVAHFRRRWQPINKAARILRALCEHPGFEAFQGDGIDGIIIRDAARELSLNIAIAGADVERLLDEPGEDDVFCIRGKLYQVNPVTGLLEAGDGDGNVLPFQRPEADGGEDDDPNGGHP